MRITESNIQRKVEDWSRRQGKEAQYCYLWAATGTDDI
jgi:hypothetical protein